MHSLRRHFARVTTRSFLHRSTTAPNPSPPSFHIQRHLSARSGGGRGRGRRSLNYYDEENGNDSRSKSRTPRQVPSSIPDPGWGGEDEFIPSWSTGLTKDHFDGSAGSAGPTEVKRSYGWERDLEEGNRKDRAFVNGWEERMKDTVKLMKQVREPGVRGEYLKDAEKMEMYRSHKSNPEVYSVDRLAKDYRILRQRVHAILWLKELEEEEERRTGKKLDDSIERLLDECPEFFISHDKEFHVASLPYKPDFKVMPVDWDGTTKDPDEVLYKISMKEDERLYQDFVENMNFNKKKIAGEVFHHKYSRRRLQKGWNFTVEKLGPLDKCRGGNAFRFVSMPDGSSRELNDLEKLYARRETPRNRRRILP